jgi:hypothetical protein
MSITLTNKAVTGYDLFGAIMLRKIQIYFTSTTQLTTALRNPSGVYALQLR